MIARRRRRRAQRILAAVRDRPAGRCRRSSRHCKAKLEAVLADVTRAVEDWSADARARARRSAQSCGTTRRRCPPRKSTKRARCSTGWKRGTSCSSAIAITGSSAARIERSAGRPTRARGLGILRSRNGAGGTREVDAAAGRGARARARPRAADPHEGQLDGHGPSRRRISTTSA